ncbi:MAG: hypothetical protein NTX03_11805 [Bacteroidetes bacterium]|nr:hypothetical protein [Bacteroidota bacterium]
MKTLENMRLASKVTASIYLLILIIFFYNVGFSIDDSMLVQNAMNANWGLFILGLLVGFISSGWGGFLCTVSILVYLSIGSGGAIFILFLLPGFMFLATWFVGKRLNK